MAITELPTATNRPRPAWLADDVISANLIHKLNEHADAAREILQLVQTWVGIHQAPFRRCRPQGTRQRGGSQPSRRIRHR